MFVFFLLSATLFKESFEKEVCMCCHKRGASGGRKPLDLSLIVVPSGVVDKIQQEDQDDDPLGTLEYSPEEIAADLEHDRLLQWAFGDHIPVVRTLPLKGSKCDVFVWSDTPRL